MSHYLFRLTLLAACFTVLGNALHAAPLRHLFLDPADVQEAKNVALVVNPPQMRELVLRPDKPWEGLMISFYLTVLDEEGKLRMWYICRDRENRPNVAYAESKDGLAWVKPDLGLVDYHGSKANNLVGLTSLEGTVYRDLKARRPEERYVYVTNLSGKGIVRFTSPDGLRWRPDRQAILPFRADTQNVAFWDDRLGCYALYLRGWDVNKDWRLRLRKVVRATTPELSATLSIKPSGADPGPLPRIVNEIPTVFAADKNDPPNTDVYTISAQPYPLDTRWYVGFPSFFLREAHVSDGRLEVQFIGSRDGVAWHRYDRKPYVAPGPAGSPSANMAFIGVGLVVRGDEIWQYGTGFHSRHGDVAARRRKTDGAIYRYVQRVDGFVSLDFGAEAARCVTAPVKVDGPRLLVNVDTGALGELRVGLLDANGSPIPGFAPEECAVFHTNSTRAAVTWKTRPNVSSIQGREVRVVFTGSRAKLYSFYFDQPRETAK